MKKLRNKIAVEVVTKELEQYDLFDHEEIFKKHKKYSEPIGMFLIAFSRLEWILNYMITNSINDRGDEPGLRIIKYLDVIDKINLANDQYRRLINLLINSKTKEKQKRKLELIISKLKEINEFRNNVAHANWITLDGNGFVRIDIKENKGDGTIYFKYAKISPSIIRKFISHTDSLGVLMTSLTSELGIV